MIYISLVQFCQIAISIFSTFNHVKDVGQCEMGSLFKITYAKLDPKRFIASTKLFGTPLVRVKLCASRSSHVTIVLCFSGTKRERGMEAPQVLPNSERVDEGNGTSIYELPSFTNSLHRYKIFSYIPCLPCYRPEQCSCVVCTRCHQRAKPSNPMPV